MPEGQNFNQSGVAVSPPGAMSQRTDMQAQGSMQIPDAAYGEQQAFQDMQGGAPMAGAPTPMAAPPVGMGAPTQRPSEPVTAGANYGDGPGSGALPTDQTMQKDMQMIGKYLPVFESMAASDSVPESFRLFVRYLRGSL